MTAKQLIKLSGESRIKCIEIQLMQVADRGGKSVVVFNLDLNLIELLKKSGYKVKKTSLRPIDRYFNKHNSYIISWEK